MFGIDCGFVGYYVFYVDVVMFVDFLMWYGIIFE